MKVRKWLLVLLLIISLMTLMAGGCGNDNKGDVIPAPSNDEENGEPSDKNDSDGFVPSVAVPEGLPVYPDAELRNDLTAGEGYWQWMYSTTGSGNDIVEFFIDALQDIGFGIDSDFSFALYDEFFINTTDEIVKVYWLDSENLAEVDFVTADTPDRWYGIIVHQSGWAAR